MYYVTLQALPQLILRLGRGNWALDTIKANDPLFKISSKSILQHVFTELFAFMGKVYAKNVIFNIIWIPIIFVPDHNHQSNQDDVGQFCADTRLIGSDGISFQVHWPLLLARGVWWAKWVDQDQADGDRVILLPHINSRELRNFVDNIYGEYPCHGWSDVETQQQQMIVETEDGQPHHHRGQWQGWGEQRCSRQQWLCRSVRLSWASSPAPIHCLLLLMRPPEWGSGHCLGVEAGVVAAPAGDSDSVLTVLALSEQPGSSSLPEESPVPLPTLEMEEKSPITTSSGLLMRSTSSTRPTTSR